MSSHSIDAAIGTLARRIDEALAKAAGLSALERAEIGVAFEELARVLKSQSARSGHIEQDIRRLLVKTGLETVQPHSPR